MRLAKEMHPDIFPFSEGEKVNITLRHPHNVSDTGPILHLRKGKHFGKDVIYAIIVKIDGVDNPRGVCESILSKITQNDLYKL